MQTLWPQAPEVPHHVRVFHVGLRITLLGVDEGRELHEVKGTGQCDTFYTQLMLIQRLLLNVYYVYCVIHKLVLRYVPIIIWMFDDKLQTTLPAVHSLTSRASLMKKMGVLLPVRSQLPPSV